MNTRNSEYPRALKAKEMELLSGILPQERKGYQLYREQVFNMVVIGDGRRGSGEIILGNETDSPNFEEPLAPVFAYGAVETSFGTISITAREISLGQASVEIVGNRLESLPDDFEESRRWTYSTWSPGDPCPQCLQAVREVQMQTDMSEQLTLAICRMDKRIWVYSPEQELVRLIPISTFYNELMLNKKIRDPNIALDSKLFFTNDHTYSDSDITLAFRTYNTLKTKVHVRGEFIPRAESKPGFLASLKRLFTSSLS